MPFTTFPRKHLLPRFLLRKVQMQTRLQDNHVLKSLVSSSDMIKNCDLPTVLVSHLKGLWVLIAKLDTK